MTFGGSDCQTLRALETYDPNTGSGFQEVCLKVMLHWAQIYLADRFQEFDNDIFDSILSALIPLTSFPVPQRYVFMSGDTLCPPADQKANLPAINSAD